jgi:hypothetical protein
MWIFSFSHVFYISGLSQPPFLNYSNNIFEGYKVRMKFPRHAVFTSCYFGYCRYNNLCSTLLDVDTVLYFCKSACKIVILIFTFLESSQEDKRF